MVTVRFDDAMASPAALLVTVSVGQRELRRDSRVASVERRPIQSGDRFAVLLPDDVDNLDVTVAIVTEGPVPALTGSGRQTARRERQEALTVRLWPLGGPDGGADGGGNGG